MARVWAESKHSGSHLLMLLAIADFADDDGNAYPAVATLAAKCRMQARNARVILAALRQSGELQVRENEGPKGTNLFRITLAEGVQSLAGMQSLAGVQANAGGDAKACRKPLQRIAAEPSLNHQEPPTHARKRASAGPDTALAADDVGTKKSERKPDPGGFAEFWDAWPRSVRKQDRKKCAEFWQRHCLGHQLATIVAHIEALKPTRAWREGYEPAPLTYLRNERWNDGSPSDQTTDDSRPQWAVKAGFANRFEAENAGCFERNAAMFRDGCRLEATV